MSSFWVQSPLLRSSLAEVKSSEVRGEVEGDVLREGVTLE
jgi:hypothetical protein